jgi:hypothetical protein
LKFVVLGMLVIVALPLLRVPEEVIDITAKSPLYVAVEITEPSSSSQPVGATGAAKSATIPVNADVATLFQLPLPAPFAT